LYTILLSGNHNQLANPRRPKQRWSRVPKVYRLMDSPSWRVDFQHLGKS